MGIEWPRPPDPGPDYRCGRCKGKGKISSFWSGEKDCPDCGGKGEIRPGGREEDGDTPRGIRSYPGGGTPA